MDGHKARERSGLLQKVKCRVCKKLVNQQSYSDHLKSKHPEEKSDNLRAAGQGSLVSWASGGGVKRKLPSEREEGGGATMEEAAGPTDMEMQVEEDTVQIDEEEREREEEEREDSEEEERQDSEEEERQDSEEEERQDSEEEEREDSEEEERVDPEEVRKVLQQMLTKEDAVIDLTDCKTETEKMNKCLNIVKKRLQIKDDVKSLIDNLKELKMTEGELKVEQLPDQINEDTVIRLARSLEEITEKVVAFMYLDDKKQISCVICGVSFSYKEKETDFTGMLMGPRFAALKTSLRKHLKTGSHIKMVKDKEGVAQVEGKEEARNRVVGRTIGGLVYDIIYNGRPDTDLPRLIYRVKMAAGT
jgi:hypothetical protein